MLKYYVCVLVLLKYYFIATTAAAAVNLVSWLAGWLAWSVLYMGLYSSTKLFR